MVVDVPHAQLGEGLHQVLVLVRQPEDELKAFVLAGEFQAHAAIGGGGQGQKNSLLTQVLCQFAHMANGAASTVVQHGQHHRELGLGDARHIQQIIEQPLHLLHLPLDHVYGRVAAVQGALIEVEGLLGAARILTHRRDVDGTVRFIFQPAEEHGRGAKAMMQDGLLERFPVDALYGVHSIPGLPAVPKNKA